ncbi:MAG: efflux RND transporter periplasmic adaptor subunit [Pseudomonadota bacterium]
MGPRALSRILVTVGISVGVLLCSFVVVGVMFAMKSEPPKKEVENLDPLVNVLELEPTNTRFRVRSQGTVRPRTETILSAEVSGTITQISPKFIAGGVFAEGETLMRIDPTNYEVALEQAEALVAQRQIEYDGAAKLREQGYRAEAELASAAAALASAKAQLVRARRDLERTYIRLPYRGIVRSKETDLGQFVNPGSRLGVVFATDIAEVRLPLTDGDLAFLDLPDAQDIEVTGSDPGPGVTLSAVKRGRPEIWEARIVRTEAVVDESSRVSFAVAEIIDPYQLESDGPPLPVGTFVSASIEGTEVSGIVRVPARVLRGSRELLFLDADNRIRIRPVDVVRSDADFAYILDPGLAGQRVVTTALEAPFNGMAVRTSDDDTTGRLASAEEAEEAEE